MKRPQITTSKALASLLAAALLATAASACKKPAVKNDDDIPVRTIRAAPVELGTRSEHVEVIGELEGMEEVRVYAQVSERLRNLAVREGDRVKKGDLLATVVGDLQSEAVLQSQAGLEAAIANRDAVLDNLKRTRVLVQGGAGTAGQLEALEAQARAAEAQVRQASSAVGSASAQKSRTVIRSPFDGVVAQITLQAGDLAVPGAPIMTVVRDDRLKAILKVPEREFYRVKEGMPVRISPLANPEAWIDSTLTMKGPIVDRLTRTGLVEVHLENGGGKVLAGSAIRARIEVERHENVVLVPAEAVLLSTETERTGSAQVFVTDGKTASRRDVTIGARQGSQLEIKEGLAAGERLVVMGAHLLRDANPVRFAEDAKPAAEAKR